MTVVNFSLRDPSWQVSSGAHRSIPRTPKGRTGERHVPSIARSRRRGVMRHCVRGYLRCLLTSFVISNIETWALPPNTGFRFSSALMLRRFLASWRPFRLM
jgi:hypothetical protein